MSETTPENRDRSGRRDALSPVTALVRRHDRDRFQTALFAPRARREALFALYAFNYEIARVREAVHEVLLGRIRLQWWREAIAAAYDGKGARRHDVVEALSAAIRCHALTPVHFERLIEAREHDLDGTPPPTLTALESYCEASSARLVYLAAEILGSGETQAARHVGIGYGISGLLRAMPVHAGAGWSYIPDEVVAEHRIEPSDYRARRATVPLRNAVAAMADTAERHLAAARATGAAVPRSGLAALLPAIVASRYLLRLKRANFDPFDPALSVPDPQQSWRLLTAALRRRF